MGAKWEAVSKRMAQDHEQLNAKLHATMEKVNALGEGVTWDGIRGVVGDFEALSTLLAPHLKAEEEIVTLETVQAWPSDKMEEILEAVGKANKGDEFGYLTLPLILWTTPDDIYDRWIRTRMPKFVRAVVCNNIMYYKGGSALVPFVPRYRGSWDI